MFTKDLFRLLIKDYWENIQKRNSLEGLTEGSNWYNALIHFKNYAYERDVTRAISVYRKIAEEVLAPLKNIEQWHADIETDIWGNFKQECDKRKIKPNERVDPLKPSKSEGAKKSIERFVWELRARENKTVANWAFNLVVQNKIQEAHQELKTVWGVSDKIASFYLRDIFWLGYSLNPDIKNFLNNDVYLLQPIDRWVERAANALGCKQNSKASIAKFVCSFEKEIGLAPGGGNIVFWMLGSNYVDSDEFKNVLGAINKGSEKDSKIALSVADRFVSFYGQFGYILKKILA